MPVIHSRADWGAQPPKRSAKLNPSKIGIVDVHWPGSKGHLARDRAGVAAALRGWQAFHMKTRGWSDIAYNIGVDLAGECGSCAAGTPSTAASPPAVMM